MKKYTYEIFAENTQYNHFIGRRKSAGSACKFAELLIKPIQHHPNYPIIVILRRERKIDDFGY